MWKFKRTREREYLSGIPARDLSDAEVEALSKDDRERFDASGLYRQVEDEPTDDKPATRRTRGGES